MWIVGVAVSHNGAVALVQDGRVRAAIQLERLQRVKRFPLRLSEEALEASIQSEKRPSVGGWQRRQQSDEGSVRGG